MESNNILDRYLETHNLQYDDNSEVFQMYYNEANSILEKTNFLLFPLEKVDTSGDNGMITNREFKCDLVVKDKNFGKGIISREVEVKREDLRNLDSLKKFLGLQADKATINNMSSKKEKDDLCDKIRLVLLTGYEVLFGVKTSYNVKRIGFDVNNQNNFIFSNGLVDVSNGEAIPGENNLIQKMSINLNFPFGEIENLTLEESLSSMPSLEKYISSDSNISKIIVGDLVNGIFRNEYKEIHNEYPFLGIEAIRGSGKTSLLNFLSRVAGFDWKCVPGTNDSVFAFETGMNSINSRFFFFDEIQKASKQLLKYIQAAYNSGENHKGGGNNNWHEIETYKKDCNLICSGEILPQAEEALLNRFIIICTNTPFRLVKGVDDEEEFMKYKMLTGKDVSGNFLNTDEIEILAKHYYRPRFLNILRNKRMIDYRKYHDEAVRLIDVALKDFGPNAPDTRMINNFIAPVTGNLILWGDSVDKNEIIGMIKNYFVTLMEYKDETYVSGTMIDYIVDNIGEFCSWLNKVDGRNTNYPMIYLKNSEREQGIVIRVTSIVGYIPDTSESRIPAKQKLQQLKEALGISKLKKSKAVKAAKGIMNISGLFVSLKDVEKNESLRKIRDSTLEYMGEHIKELERIRDENLPHKMSDGTLNSLIQEINQSYDRSEFFDTESFNKEIPVEVIPF